jgi:hypothetical protein
LYVSQSPVGKAPLPKFRHGITLWNSPKFIKPPSGTPTAAFNPVLHRHVERGPIDTGLSAGNDLHARGSIL